MLIQCRTGSESHTTEWRSCQIWVNGKPIYQELKSITQEWELIGNKGKHGKWATAEYEIPNGASVKFVAKANGKPNIEHTFIVGKEIKVDFDGYSYHTRLCGWIVSI